MKKVKFIILGLLVTLLMIASTENYSNGERIGLVTKFSETGLIFKTYEGDLNLTQTGMNSSSSSPFKFSLDSDNENKNIIATLDSASTYGWKVKIIYHETFLKNWFNNRGLTDYFVSSVDILDKNPIGNIFSGENSNIKSVECDCKTGGHVIDTIYVVIDKTK